MKRKAEFDDSLRLLKKAVSRLTTVVPQFEGGNVVIHLDKKNIMVLPDAHLRERSNYFESVLSKRWGPVTFAEDKTTQIFKFNLVLDQDLEMWLLSLEGTSVTFNQSMGTQETADSQSSSVLLPMTYERIIPRKPDCPQRQPPADCLPHAIEEHRALFELLCGIDPKPFTGGSIDFCLQQFANLVAYADYYGCLPQIGTNIIKLLRRDIGNEAIYDNMSNNSAFHLGLAYHLRDEDLFSNALRHYVGQSECYCHYELSESVRLLPPDVSFLAIQKHRELLGLIDEMEQGLRRPMRGFLTEAYFLTGAYKQEGVRAKFLARSLVKDVLDHGKLWVGTGQSRKLVYDDVETRKERSVARRGGGEFFKALMEEIDRAIDTGKYDRLLRKPNSNVILGEMLNVDIVSFNAALKDFLRRMGYALRPMVDNQAEGKIPDSQFYFTAVNVEDDEFPWPQPYEDFELEDSNFDRASVKWLKNLRLLDVVGIPHGISRGNS